MSVPFYHTPTLLSLYSIVFRLILPLQLTILQRLSIVNISRGQLDIVLKLLRVVQLYSFAHG